MALLQIAEPGQALDPHQRRIAVGIDLGTTHSLVAAVRHGVAECLPDAKGRVILPSAVHIKPDRGRSFGDEALSQAAADPANVITSVKRLMGRCLKDVADAARLPYELVDTPGMVSIRTREGNKSPVEISAEILATLRQRAEDSFDEDLFGAVITVPAYFDDAQRQATKDAAQLAGIHVLRLINEPTAAAIAYGLDNAAEGIYAVYDLGGGTFDISILRLSAGVFEVIAAGGDSALGGDDYDALVAAEIERQCGFKAETPEQKAALRATAREIKEALSATESVARNVQITPTCRPFSLDRAGFEALTDALTQRTLKAVRKTLRDAKLEPSDVRGVVMVGGSTRMPVIRRLVGELFGQEPLVNLNPDEVVALGAAIQANQLAGNNAAGDLLLLDVTPLSLGIETMGGLVERIVPRNQAIPVAMAQDFTTYQDGQTAMTVHVVQGERDMVADCRSLARFTLRGIPPMAAGAARIRVTFAIDADGLLSVTAKEQLSGVEAQVQVKPSYGLADGEIARMLQESFATAQADMAARALAQARLDVDRTVLATRSALELDGDLLTPGERMEIEALISAAIAAKALTEPAPIEAANKALAAGTEAFAAQRMNAGIRKALTGRSINQV